MAAAEKTAEADVTTEDPGVGEQLAFGNAYYEQSPEDRAESRRNSALHFATSIRTPGHSRAAEVVADAKLFDAFLRGETGAEV